MVPAPVTYRRAPRKISGIKPELSDIERVHLHQIPRLVAEVRRLQREIAWRDRYLEAVHEFARRNGLGIRLQEFAEAHTAERKEAGGSGAE